MSICPPSPPFQTHRKARTFAINPNGWPKVFCATFKFHAAFGDEPAFCSFDEMTAGGESVTDWCNVNILLDESALEEEALSRVPPHISGDWN